MNLQQYYRRIRECEEGLASRDVWVASLATADGGREGVLSEVPRRVAARMVVDGLARLAEPEEIEREVARRESRRPCVPTAAERIAVEARGKKPAK